jgi:hypothetical protein
MIAETICSAVSAAGLGIAAVTAYRRRFLSALRITAYALVPVALVMIGVVQWIADTAFSVTAWAGFAVLGVAWVLFMISRAVERRTVGTRKERRAAAKAAKREAVAPAASTPSAVPGKLPAVQPAAAPRGKAKDDFSDIEAILKKHGI